MVDQKPLLLLLPHAFRLSPSTLKIRYNFFRSRAW